MKKLLLIILLALPISVMANHPNGTGTAASHDGLSAHQRELLERRVDLLFDWLEMNYSNYFPSRQHSFYSGGYRTRYYPINDGYLFVKDDNVHFTSSYQELEVFPLEFWLELSGITAREEREKEEREKEDRRREKMEQEEEARREEVRKEELRQEEERKEAARQEDERKYRDFRAGVIHKHRFTSHGG